MNNAKESKPFFSPLLRAKTFGQQHKSTLLYCLFAGLAALTPLFLSEFLYAMRGTGLNLFRTLPSFSDDFFYYSQIKAMLAYGHPLGHIGSALQYAPVGSFGFWGVATLLPYAGFAFIFGLHYNTIAVTNALLIVLANVLFIWLVRMKRSDLGWFALANALSFATVFYFTSSSSMPLRYALAIVLCGMLARCFLFPTAWWFRRIVVPTVLIFAACCYAPFAVLIPCFFAAGYKNRKSLVLRLLLSLPFTGALAGGVLWMNNRIWAKFFLLNDTAADAYLHALTQQPLQLISLSYQRLITVLAACEPISLLFGSARDSFAANPFKIFYFASFWIFLALSIAALVRYRKNKNVQAFHWLYLYLFLTLFAATIMISQDDYLSTTFRFLTVPICCVLVLSSICEKKDLLRGIAFASIFAVIPFLSYFQEAYPDYCFATADTVQNLDRLSADYESAIPLSPDADPWENTIALDLHDWRSTIALPAGISMNLCTGGTKPDNLAYEGLTQRLPKYVMTCTDACAMCAYKEQASPLAEYLAMGYRVVYEDAWAQAVILERAQ